MIAAYWLDVQDRPDLDARGKDRVVGRGARLPDLDPDLRLRRRAELAAVASRREPRAGSRARPLRRVRGRRLHLDRSRRKARTLAATMAKAASDADDRSRNVERAPADAAALGTSASSSAIAASARDRRRASVGSAAQVRLRAPPSQEARTSQRSPSAKLIPQFAPLSAGPRSRARAVDLIARALDSTHVVSDESPISSGRPASSQRRADEGDVRRRDRVRELGERAAARLDRRERNHADGQGEAEGGERTTTRNMCAGRARTSMGCIGLMPLSSANDEPDRYRSLRGRRRCRRVPARARCRASRPARRVPLDPERQRRPGARRRGPSHRAVDRRRADAARASSAPPSTRRLTTRSSPPSG